MIRCGVVAFAAGLVVMLLSGCGVTRTGNGKVAGAGLSGEVHGGQQPVVGATVQLYTVGTVGDGSAATPLLTQTVTTDVNGGFRIATIPCTNTTEVYLTATGGNPGLAGGVNPNLAEMVALGSCAALQTAAFVAVNEVTTVAAVAALAPYMNSPTGVGSGTGDAAGLAAAFGLVTAYADPATGLSPGPGVPNGTMAPTAEIYTLADILAACVNSTGGTAGSSTLCGQLFTLATPPGGVVPTDTITALVDVEKNPTLNTAALFSLVQAAAPFQPPLSAAPANFAVSLTPQSGVPGLTVSSVGLSFPATAVGFTAQSQTVTISNSGSVSVTLNGITLIGVSAAEYTQTNTCGSALGVGASCTVRVAFTPAVAGARDAELLILSSAAGSPQTVALAGAAGTPSAGPVMVSATSLRYTVAYTIQDLTLSNYGSTPLTIRGISSSDPTFQVETNGCGTFLPAQSVCTISVESTGFQFNGSIGLYVSYSGTLKIDDDAAAGVQTVALSSTNSVLAQGSAFTSAATLDFGAWPVGSAVTGRSVSINPGSYYSAGSFNFTLGGTNPGDFIASATTYCSYGMGMPCAFPLTFKPSGTGLRTAKFLAYGGPAYVRLLGTGDAAGPSFTVSYASSTFSSSSAYVNQYGIATVTNTYTVLNNGTTTLNLAYASTGANSANYSASGNCASVAPQGTCSVQITFTSTTVGTFPGAITIRDQNSTYSQVVTQSILAFYPVVQVSPGSLTFAAQGVGTTSAAQTFMIQNGNIYPFVSLGHPISVSAPRTGSFTLPSGSTCPASTTICTLSVAFSPLITGTIMDSLTVTDLTSGNTTTLSLSGVGGSPVVMLSTKTVTFPARPVSTTSVPMDVTVTNSGTVPMSVSSVIVVGAVNGNFTQTNNCSTVAVGASCTIGVMFAPTAAGVQSASIQVVSNAASSPDAVQLTGTAQ